MTHFSASTLPDRLAALARTGERRLLLLTGEPDWCIETVRRHLPARPLWFGDGPAEYRPVRGGKALNWLGREHPQVVVNGFCGLNPDLLGALVGTLQAGGALWLLMPPPARWPTFPDPDLRRFVSLPEHVNRCHGHFLSRLWRQLANQPALWHWDQETGLAPARLPAPDPGWQQARQPADEWQSLSPDQHAAVAAILHCARGHRGRPLVLSSDRGRGKSSALGIAAAQLLQQPGYRILLTAPAKTAVQSLLAQLRARLPAAVERDDGLSLGSSHLDFYSPERLLAEAPAGDLLLVDEAAAIPAPLLLDLLHRHARIVFATTLHGYEGSGRGFALRMRRHLSQLTPGWQEQALTTPIRWSEQDPLEPLINRLLRLDTEVDTPPRLTGQPRLERLDQARLAGDEALLRQVFGLLVLAHYQTSPSDLRTLLDSPDLAVFALRQQEAVLAVALVSHEGQLPPDLAREIRAGRRRPRGQLLPQTLLAHAGVGDAGEYRYARIMRIAVQPDWQRHGLGRQLLTCLTDHYRAQGFDFIGSAFGATAELLPFWRRQGFVPVRLGLSRDAASGTHSAVLLQALQPALEPHLRAWQCRFQQQLPHWLGQALARLPAELVVALLDPACCLQRLDDHDWQDLADCAFGQRSLDHALPALRHWLAQCVAAWSRLPAREQALLVGRLWQGHDWQTLAARWQLAGQKQVQACLRQALRQAGVPNPGAGQ